MAEFINLSERMNPEGLKTRDICQIKLSGGILSVDKVKVVSVKGSTANVRLLVGFGNNVDGLAWCKLEDGTDISLDFAGVKTIPLKYLSKVKP